MIRGKPFVIIFVAICLVAAVASTIVMIRGYDDARANQAGIGLAKAQTAAEEWARANGGAYPRHVALLATLDRFNLTFFRDPRLPEESVWTIGGVDTREVAAGSVPDEVLFAAVEGEEIAPTYRFGDYWFTALDEHRASDALIFGWTLPDEEGRRFVVWDSGEVKRVGAGEWTGVWARDAAAREALGLAMLPMPGQGG